MSTITELNPRLLALTEAGVSVWLDQIRRSMVEGGELARMVAVESLRGVTSNPSIFEKAILGSTDYDEDLRALAHENLDSVAIYERIAIRDVQLAADVLAEVHRELERARRVRVAGGGAGAGARHRGHARAGPLVLEARRPAECDDQDPRDARGRPGDRGGSVRGHQRQRHAAVLARGVREGGRGVLAARSSAGSARAWS